MPSPFPGMDPYIEVTAGWAGFHNAFLSTCAQQLNRRLPPNYVARIEERLQILSEEEERELGVIQIALCHVSQAHRRVLPPARARLPRSSLGNGTTSPAGTS